MPPPPSPARTLRAENAELRARLEEAEETLRAIRAGEVDALVVEGTAGPQIYTLQGLDAEQNRLRGAMLAQVSDSVIAVDNEEHITFLNATAERQYGVRADEVVGRKLDSMITRDWSSPEAEAKMWTAMSERGEWRGELIHRTHDGREMHIESSAAVLRGPDGERIGVVRTIRDVSERKQLELEKAEALRLLDTLLTHAPVGFVFLDRDLRFVRINERLAEINGFSIAAHLGKTVAKILPTLEATLREVTGRILATGQPVLDHEFSGETARAPGIPRYWNQSWYPVHNERGEIIGFGGVVDEITERKRAEEALRDNERRFRGIFDSAYHFIGLMTPDGTVLEANRTALEAGELRAENVIGKPFWECDWWTLTERTGRELRTAIGRAASGELVRYDVDVRGAEGQVVTLDFSIKPIRDEAGRVVLLIPEGRDITSLKQAEENMRLTNQRFALAVKCSQVVLWQQDLELRFTWLHNPAPGIDGSNPVGKRDEDLLERMEDAAEIVALKREVIRSGVGLRREFSPQIQGVIHCFEVLMEPLRDTAGRITGITGAAIDISELKRTEAARHQLERKYRALAVASYEVAYRMSADWSTMLPLDGRHLVASPDQSLANWAWLDQNLPREEHPRVREAIREAIARKALFELEHRVWRPDGTIGWTLSRAVPILDENEDVIEWFGAASDITQRKAAEAALSDNEERMRLATEATEVGIWEWNVISNCIRWDAQMFRLYGVAPTADGYLSYETWRRAVLPEDLARQEELLQETVRRGGKSTREFRIHRADSGECRCIQAVETVRYNEEGKAEWVVGTNLDVTAQRKAQSEIREASQKAVAANAAKDRFIATLSHELRTPLTPVLLVSEVYAKSKKLSGDLREDFAMIHRNILLEAHLIDDLLDVSRIQQGKMRFEFQLVDVNEAVARTLEMLRAEMEDNGIAIRQELGARRTEVQADPARFGQVLCNLLRNAVKFTPCGGTITVRTACDESALQISITDTGAGIAAEDLERIFQPFEQVDAQQRSAHGGLGLGLAISGAIVDAHRGRIWAESPGPGQGATFHLSLPF